MKLLFSFFYIMYCNSQNEEFSVVLVTCEQLDEAKIIAKSLVEEKLAACVSIFPEVISTYIWNNELHQHSEIQLIIKTRSLLFEKVMIRIIQLHSAEVPEIIELKISNLI